jgi:2-desacetyl-2-hydroxyethyl bacteriochlorophyllide A dehydrogenase
MRAATLEAPGLLRFREAPIPAPGPGQVRLRIEASGVCGTDVHLWRGRFGAPLPLVLGHEAVGIVDAVATGVVAPRVGDRVGVPWAQRSCGACTECAAGRRRFCTSLTTWMKNGGSHADYALAEAQACVAVPDGLSSVLAAPLFCAGHTAFAALEAGNAQPGSRVAIIGVGGLGHLAVQLAAQRGCEVFAVTHNPTKVAEVKRMGANAVLAGDDPVLELGKAGGVDVIISTTSDPSAAGRLVPALRPEGRLAIAGLGESPLSFDSAALVQRGASIVSVVPGDPAQLREVLRLAAEGRISPIVERYPFGQLRRILYRLADSRVRYRAVMDVEHT